MSNRYLLNHRDKKLAGVCATIADMINLDPIFVRIGFVAFALLIEWELALVAYVAAGLFFHFKARRAERRGDRRSDFEKMADAGRARSSVHALRTQLDVNDRRMMAIDHHLNSQNEELAREIDALREEK